MRRSVQRDAIQQALAQAPGPLLPEEILAAAQGSCPSLGQATVYRALSALEEAGAVARVIVSDGRPRYETARGHHHHFHCRACSRVFDIEGCVRSPQQFADHLPDGFLLEDHELTLHGLCAQCTAARSG